LVALTGSAALAAALLLGSVSPAAALPTCDYSASDHKVTIVVDEVLHLRRNIADRITVNGAWCDGQATAYNTDRIAIFGGAGAQHIFIYMDYGGFRPGFTDEPGTSDEIEISVSLGGGADYLRFEGSELGEHITIGKSSGFGVQGRINLDANETSGIDADLTLILGVEEVAVFGNGGGDVISGLGGDGTGDAAPFALTLRGHNGADQLAGGAAGDSIIGGYGDDILKGGAGPDDINATDFVSGNDQIFGGGGADTCVADAGDFKASCP